jgi:hypothetical protein
MVEPFVGRAHRVFDEALFAAARHSKLVALAACPSYRQASRGGGLAVEAGLVQLLEIWKARVVTTMALPGATRLDQFTAAPLM